MVVKRTAKARRVSRLFMNDLQFWVGRWSACGVATLTRRDGRVKRRGLFSEIPAPARRRAVAEAEAPHRDTRHQVHRFLGGVRQLESLLVAGIDGALHEQAVPYEVGERTPVFAPHEHDGELADLAGLHERCDLEYLVERPEAAGQRDEGVGVLHEHDPADVEVA